MLNRATITNSVKYLFDNIKKFDPKSYYEFLKTNNMDLPVDVQETVEKMYYEILLNNKNIDLDTQLNIVNDHYNTFKKYINDNNLSDRVVETKLMLMEIEIPIMTKFLKQRNGVRLIRKGYK